MPARSRLTRQVSLVAGVLVAVLTTTAVAQNATIRANSSKEPGTNKKSKGVRVADASAKASSAGEKKSSGVKSAGALEPLSTGSNGRPTAGRITKGAESLPNDAGQVWREYDLTPYTRKLTDIDHPEQAMVDWVLRETGTDVWFRAPLGILSADRDKLRVYHTPQMQEKVKGIYERFMAAPGEQQVMAIKLVTLGSPNWRSRALGLMKPVEVRTQGLEAWLMSRENAAILINDLRKRSDFKEHASPTVPVPNGQTLPLTRRTPRNYRKTFAPTADGLIAPVMGQIDEGYTLEISPLMSADGEVLDCVMRCGVDQIEKLVTVGVDVPFGGAMQRQEIQVPQLVSWNLHERFRWPSKQVLLLSCGVVATPSPDNTPAGLPKFFSTTGRADALLFVELVASEERGAAPKMPQASNPFSLAPGGAKPAPANRTPDSNSAAARVNAATPPDKLPSNTTAPATGGNTTAGSSPATPPASAASLPPGPNPGAPGGVSRGRY